MACFLSQAQWRCFLLSYRICHDFLPLALTNISFLDIWQNFLVHHMFFKNNYFCDYFPYNHYDKDEELRSILDWMASNFFTTECGEALVRNIRNNLFDGGDPFFVLADFVYYVRTQKKVDEAYKDKQKCAQKSNFEHCTLWEVFE
jgi:hypothetical protein